MEPAVGLAGIPRFAERRAIEIEQRTAMYRCWLAAALCRAAGDLRRGPPACNSRARRPAASARKELFDDVNALVDEHNRRSPIERNLPLDPATGRYPLVLGPHTGLERLDAGWAMAVHLGANHAIPRPETPRRRIAWRSR